MVACHGFILYQLRVLLRAIRDLHEYLGRKALELRETEELFLRATAVSGALNHRQLALVHHALRKPSARYSVQSHRVSHGISYETARSDLMRLVERGLLDQRKAGKAFAFVPAHDLHSRLGVNGE